MVATHLDPQLDLNQFQLVGQRLSEAYVALPTQAGWRAQQFLGRLDRGVGNGQHQAAVGRARDLEGT